MSHKSPPVPSKNALVALRRLAFSTPTLVVGALGSACGIVTLHCEVRRRIKIAESIVATKKIIRSVSNADGRARFAKMCEAAERGEEFGLNANRNRDPSQGRKRVRRHSGLAVPRPPSWEDDTVLLQDVLSKFEKRKLDHASTPQTGRLPDAGRPKSKLNERYRSVDQPGFLPLPSVPPPTSLDNVGLLEQLLPLDNSRRGQPIGSQAMDSTDNVAIAQHVDAHSYKKQSTPVERVHAASQLPMKASNDRVYARPRQPRSTTISLDHEAAAASELFTASSLTTDETTEIQSSQPTTVPELPPQLRRIARSQRRFASGFPEDNAAASPDPLSKESSDSNIASAEEAFKVAPMKNARQRPDLRSQVLPQNTVVVDSPPTRHAPTLTVSSLPVSEANDLFETRHPEAKPSPRTQLNAAVDPQPTRKLDFTPTLGDVNPDSSTDSTMEEIDLFFGLQPDRVEKNSGMQLFTYSYFKSPSTNSTADPLDTPCFRKIVVGTPSEENWLDTYRSKLMRGGGSPTSTKLPTRSSSTPPAKRSERDSPMRRSEGRNATSFDPVIVMKPRPVEARGRHGTERATTRLPSANSKVDQMADLSSLPLLETMEGIPSTREILPSLSTHWPDGLLYTPTTQKNEKVADSEPVMFMNQTAHYIHESPRSASINHTTDMLRPFHASLQSDYRPGLRRLDQTTQGYRSQQAAIHLPTSNNRVEAAREDDHYSGQYFALRYSQTHQRMDTSKSQEMSESRTDIHLAQATEYFPPSGEVEDRSWDPKDAEWLLQVACTTLSRISDSKNVDVARQTVDFLLKHTSIEDFRNRLGTLARPSGWVQPPVLDLIDCLLDEPSLSNRALAELFYYCFLGYYNLSMQHRAVRRLALVLVKDPTSFIRSANLLFPRSSPTNIHPADGHGTHWEYRYPPVRLYLDWFCKTQSECDSWIAETKKIASLALGRNVPIHGLLIFPVVEALVGAGQVLKAQKFVNEIHQQYELEARFSCTGILLQGYAYAGDWQAVQRILDHLHARGLSRSVAIRFASLFSTALAEYFRQHSLNQAYDYLQHALHHWGVIPLSPVSKIVLPACIRQERFDLVYDWTRIVRQKYQNSVLSLEVLPEMAQAWSETRASCFAIAKFVEAIANASITEHFRNSFRAVVVQAVVDDLKSRLISSRHMWNQLQPDHSEEAISRMSFREVLKFVNKLLRTSRSAANGTHLQNEFLPQMRAVSALHDIFSGNSHQGQLQELPSHRALGPPKPSAPPATIPSEILENPGLPRSQLWPRVFEHYSTRQLQGQEQSHAVLDFLVPQLVRQRRSGDALSLLESVYESPFAQGPGSTPFTLKLFTAWLKVAHQHRNIDQVFRACWAVFDSDLTLDPGFLLLVRRVTKIDLNQKQKIPDSMQESWEAESKWLYSRFKKRHWIQRGMPADSDVRLPDHQDWAQSLTRPGQSFSSYLEDEPGLVPMQQDGASQPGNRKTLDLPQGLSGSRGYVPELAKDKPLNLFGGNKGSAESPTTSTLELGKYTPAKPLDEFKGVRRVISAAA